MDFLKAEIARKRNLLSATSAGGVEDVDGQGGRRRKRYVRAADYRRAEEEAEQSVFTSRAKSRGKHGKTDGKADGGTKPAASAVTSGGGVLDIASPDAPVAPADPPISRLPPEEITRRLRLHGVPVFLFGETEADRHGRLLELLKGAAHADEFRLGSGHGIRNTFLDKGGDGAGRDLVVAPQRPPPTPQSDGKEKAEAAAKHAAATSAATDDGSDDHRLIHSFFKSQLTSWEADLSARPESERRSAHGRMEAKTVKQCRDYIRPLFRLCKSRELMADQTTKIAIMARQCIAGEFVKAHDAYIDLAIGRAAWPIGVTMVGIHARSGRERIASDNVAHVMNSELQRKYLTSVKRLMTYCQKKRTDVGPSMKVG